jgi:hypothetical protein
MKHSTKTSHKINKGIHKKKKAKKKSFLLEKKRERE